MLNAFLNFLLVAGSLSSTAAYAQKTEQAAPHFIQAEQLKSWYDQKKAMTVVDARSEKYFDGTLLPNAIWLPADSSEEEIQAALPSKNSLIVVYCFSTQCPASGWLYDKLIAMGYTNVYDYHGGLKEWKAKGYPTQ